MRLPINTTAVDKAGGICERGGRTKPAVSITLFSLVFCLASFVLAQEAEVNIDEANVPIYEGEQYDEIILNDPDHSVVKVRPLNIEPRRTPKPADHKKSEKLIVRQIDDPTEDYEVKWGDIAQVRLFEGIVLDEARKMVRAGKDDPGKFDEVYPYFQFLKLNFPATEGLNEALADYLYEDAGSFHRRGMYENALALLNELAQLDPQYPRLPTAIGATTQKLIEPYLAKDDYPAARRLLARLAKKFPQNDVVARFHDEWAGEARKIVEEGRQRLAANEPLKAWEMAKRVLYVWPRSPDAKKFFEELYAAWPRIVVGVTSPLGPVEQPRLASWATRRDGRLLERLLMEYTGKGAEGGKYVCPFGEVERTDIGRRVLFRIKRDIRSSAGGPPLTGYDVARQLVALCDVGQPRFEPTWAELFGGVSVQDVYQVDVDLRWSYVQPLALLETPVAPLKVGGAAANIGPYLRGESKGGEVHFQANPAYFGAQPGQPREIVETYLADSAAAWRALERGQVQLVDRISPWDVERYQAKADYVVEQYALPTLHMLVPNLNKPFMKHRCFRRAMAYAIDRELVLKHHLLREKSLAGCQLISGPFPIGNGFDDPLRYAYNSDVEQRLRIPRLAMALSQVALHDLAEAAKKRGEPEVKEFPKLVLAHPANDIAREACKGIQRHIQSLKFTVELRELEPGFYLPPDDNFDLLFLEAMIQEPLVDAARLLGVDGVVGDASPYLNLALVQLAKATNWQEARQILQRVHQVAADDVAIIPLWQMPEHFAYHRSLKGIEARPVLLYQSVERWKGVVMIPSED